MTRKSLSDILRADQRDAIADAWNDTEAAEDLLPLPTGEYVCRLVAGELFTSKTKGTAGYKLAFSVLEGDHTGRKFWHDIWLTPAALAMAKRDLSKLGITALDQLERPLPPGIRCAVKVTLRKDDDGTEYNRVRSFAVVGLDTPEADPFAPADVAELPQAADESAGGVA
ncbi:MAG: DUF669 domain-containing protein [Pirellulales bacterium]